MVERAARTAHATAEELAIQCCSVLDHLVWLSPSFYILFFIWIGTFKNLFVCV